MGVGVGHIQGLDVEVGGGQGRHVPVGLTVEHVFYDLISEWSGAREKTRRGWVFVSVGMVTEMPWLRMSLGGWLPTSDACGRSPWHCGSGRPAAALPAGSALARLTGRELANGNLHRLPAVPGQRPRLERTAAPRTVVTQPVRKEGGPKGDSEGQTGPGAGSRRCLVCQAERDPTYRCCPSYRGVLPNRGVPPYRKPNRPRCQLPSLPRLPSRTRPDVPMLPAAPAAVSCRTEPEGVCATDKGSGDCPAVPRCRPSGALREVLLGVHPG